MSIPHLAFLHWERPGSHWIGGWMGPRAGLDGCEKFHLHQDWSPDNPAYGDSLYRLHYLGPVANNGTSLDMWRAVVFTFDPKMVMLLLIKCHYNGVTTNSNSFCDRLWLQLVDITKFWQHYGVQVLPPNLFHIICAPEMIWYDTYI
jgi:hypothetical protein